MVNTKSMRIPVDSWSSWITAIDQVSTVHWAGDGWWP
jgi:hypothetical protein